MRPLRTYDDWKHCITKICGIPLTQEFIAQRLRELRNSEDFNTQRFVNVWGGAHLQQVIVWFEQAESEFSPAT